MGRKYALAGVKQLAPPASAAVARQRCVKMSSKLSQRNDDALVHATTKPDLHKRAFFTHIQFFYRTLRNAQHAAVVQRKNATKANFPAALVETADTV